jgi:hypothetical protein
MFVTKRDYSKELDAATPLFEGQPRGALVTYEQIQAASGIKKESKWWGSFASKLKRRLESKGVLLLSVPGVGYRIPTELDCLEKIPDSLQRSRNRKLRREAMFLSNMRQDELTPLRFQFQATRIQQVTEEAKSLKVTRATVASYLSAPQTLPKPTRNIV